MLFNSAEFLFLFLPASLAAYFLLARRGAAGAALGSLVAASLFFYGWWNPIYLPLIAGSILFNFLAGRALARRASGGLLACAVAANLGLLGWYKYADFFVETVNQVAGTGWPMLRVVLPLGISFFTFTQIAFLVDAWRGEVKEYDPVSYALFVTYFPHLLAGPILHHREMMPQFADRANRAVNWENLARGTALLAIGLAKKTLVADHLAGFANAGFDQPHAMQFFEAWFVALAYTGQLYFDFSGYSDMALGLSLLFNIRLPLNFNSPYKALDLQDFWRRWHMTLSRFLRDYVYIPLGGNRGGEAATLRNLFLTFAIGGLWHGAGWTFVVWGVMHGVGLCVHRLWQRTGRRLPRRAAWLLTFVFVVCAWVFFRARSLGDAFDMLAGMAGMHGATVSRPLARLSERLGGPALPAGEWLPGAGTGDFAIVLLVLAACARLPNSQEIVARMRFDGRSALAVGVALAAGFLTLGRVTQFLYFNF